MEHIPHFKLSFCAPSFSISRKAKYSLRGADEELAHRQRTHSKKCKKGLCKRTAKPQTVQSFLAKHAQSLQDIAE